MRIALFSGMGFVFLCWWATGLAVAVALFAHLLVRYVGCFGCVSDLFLGRVCM